jgi:flagellar biosynthesis protein FlhG
VVVDADLGGANLHTALGVLSPERTMADFIHRRIDRIEDAIVPTGIENLGLISGAHDFLTASNLNYQQKSRLLSRIAAVDADFILLDIGAGLSFNIVDFFLLAHTGLLVVIPEPSSVENAYRFLKMSFFRNLRLAVKQEEVRRYIDEAMDSKNTRGIKSPVELLDAVERLDSEAGRILRDKAARFRPALVVNQLRLPEDGRLGPSITSVCRKHLGLQMDFLGSVGYEDSVWRANRRRQPFLLLFPNSAAAFTIDALAGRLLNRAPPG